MATKKNTARKPDLSALYALVGVADYAVAQARDAADQAQARALGLSDELRPVNVQARVNKAATDVRTQVVDLLAQLGDLPTTAQSQLDAVTADLEAGFAEFAARGEKIVGELRNQPTAKRISGAADGVSEDARKAVKRARQTAEDASSLAVAGVHAGRKQAAKSVAQLAGQVEETAAQVEHSAAQVEAEARTAQRSEAAKQGAARPSRKAVAKKATAKKAPAKKATAKKAPAKKATVTKSAAAAEPTSTDN